MVLNLFLRNFANVEYNSLKRNHILNTLPARKTNLVVEEIINNIYPISTNSISEIESNIEYNTIEKGKTFVKRNRRNNKEYFILDGVCRSYLINPEGDDITISFFIQSSIISPFSTRTENQISVLNFQALTELKIATIDSGIFEKLMLENKEIRNFGNTVLRNELKQKISKEIGLASLSAKERLLTFRKDYPNLENRIPHTIIASYLGITNISLSRLRGDMTK